MATLVGVAIGVPIALWLDSKRTSRTEAGETASRRAALLRVIEALRESITWNGEKAATLQEDISAGNLPFETPLEAARWEAVRPEFVRLSNNAELNGRVAFFFDQVGRARRMADRRLEFAVGLSAGTTFAGQITKALTGHLLTDLPSIAHEANELSRILSEEAERA